jgi:hypothetical protein
LPLRHLARCPQGRYELVVALRWAWWNLVRCSKSTGELLCGLSTEGNCYQHGQSPPICIQ